MSSAANSLQRAGPSLIIGFVLCALVVTGCGERYQTNASAIARAEGAFDEPLLIEGLEKIKIWHVRNGTEIVDELRPGLDVSRIDEILLDADCTPTDEIRSLWSWHDGAVAATPFIWYHNFLPLEEAISQLRLLTTMPFSEWPSSYLPAFFFDGEWYGLHCGGGGRKAGPVLFYYLEDEARVTHVSLTSFISQMAETLETEAVTWENEGMVEDIQAVYRIHQQHNPGYPFPYYVETQ